MRRGNSERGSATIEATVSLTIFVFVIMAIYMLVNFCLVQAKVAVAINTTAKEMSQYAYFYHVAQLDRLDASLDEEKKQAVEAYTELNNIITGTGEQIDKVKANPDSIIGLLQDASELDWNHPAGELTDNELADLYGSIQKANAMVSDVIDDPVQFMKSIGAMAAEGAFTEFKSRLVAAPIARGLTRHHFGGSKEEANAYLEGLGVERGYEGLNFNLSSLFSPGSPDDVKVVVVYNMNLAKFFPFKLDITIQQMASTRGWLGGDMNTNRS